MGTSRSGRQKACAIVLGLIGLACIVTWVYPFILVVLNSVKTQRDMMRGFLDVPMVFHWENYANAWNKLNFPRAMSNSFQLAVGGVAGIILFASMSAYKLARTETRYSKVLFTLCIIPMMVPFQTIMITLTQLAKTLGLSGSIGGLIVLYWGFSTPFTLFLYHGFVKSLPRELDESALIDGASPLRLFFQIILPLLMPITSTAIVINGLYIWNDFILPLLTINASRDTRNIQMAIYSNFGSRGVRWDLALPSLVIGMVPALLFFVFLQKYIIAGVAAGAVKG